MATATKSLPNLRPAPFLTSGQLSKETSLRQSRIQELVPEGLPAFKNVSRSVIGVAHDLSTDRRLVQLMKSNDGELARSAFQARVIGVDITIDGRTEKVGKWVMEGVSLSDLDTVLAAREQGNRGASAAERAKDALASTSARGEAVGRSEAGRGQAAEHLRGDGQARVPRDGRQGHSHQGKALAEAVAAARGWRRPGRRHRQRQRSCRLSCEIASRAETRRFDLTGADGAIGAGHEQFLVRSTLDLTGLDRSRADLTMQLPAGLNWVHT
jgi:hypothetical protein